MGLPVSRRAAARAAQESSLYSGESGGGLLSSPTPKLGNQLVCVCVVVGDGCGKGTPPLPSPPEPLFAHLFEIYGKIFGLSQWAGGHRCVAWDGGVEDPKR